MPSLSPESRARALIATRDAAGAFLEDMAHIRETLQRNPVSPRDLRHLSAILRRLLTDGGGDLRAIAPPRVGRLMFVVPDNSAFYYSTPKNKSISLLDTAPSLFLSGGPKVFGNDYRALASGWPANKRPVGLDVTRTVEVGMDGFLNQRVLSLQHEWASRRDIIKYIAHIASGVHSGAPSEAAEHLLSRARNAVRLTPIPGSDSIKVEFNMQAIFGLPTMQPLKYDNTSLDIVFIELMSTAYYLCNSQSIIDLEKVVAKELE